MYVQEFPWALLWGSINCISPNFYQFIITFCWINYSKMSKEIFLARISAMRSKQAKNSRAITQEDYDNISVSVKFIASPFSIDRNAIGCYDFVSMHWISGLKPGFSISSFQPNPKFHFSGFQISDPRNSFSGLL